MPSHGGGHRFEFCIAHQASSEAKRRTKPVPAKLPGSARETKPDIHLRTSNYAQASQIARSEGRGLGTDQPDMKKALKFGTQLDSNPSV